MTCPPFSELVEIYYPTAQRLAQKFLKEPADAEDAVQDAFLSAFKAYSRFRGDSNPKSWLNQIVVNAALQKVRKAKRDPEPLPEGFDGVDKELEPGRNLVNHELGDLLTREMAGLNTLVRPVVISRYVDRLTGPQTARRLGLTLVAANSRFERGRKTLRARLKPYREDSMPFPIITVNGDTQKRWDCTKQHHLVNLSVIWNDKADKIELPCLVCEKLVPINKEFWE